MKLVADYLRVVGTLLARTSNACVFSKLMHFMNIIVALLLAGIATYLPAHQDLKVVRRSDVSGGSCLLD